MTTKKKLNHLSDISNYYNPKLAMEGPDYAVLGWESQQAHVIRFEELVRHINLDGKTLLDVGCGLGSLYDYLKQKMINVEYTGIDILEGMIEKARKKNPQIEFLCTDVFDETTSLGRTFDVLYASGIFNLNLGNNIKFLKTALGRFFSLTRSDIVFNALHIDSSDKEDSYFYTSPEEISLLLKPYSSQFYKLEFYHSYLKNDFTVIIRK